MTRRRLRALGLLLAAAAVAGAAPAHVIAQRAGLRQLLQGSDVAVVVEFVSPLRMWEAADGSDRQEYFSVRTLETLRGAAPPARFDVFPHGEGMPAWREGERALLFLERTASRPEFARLAARFPYFTIQEAGQEWSVSGADGARVHGAARAYRKLEDATGPAAGAALRTLLAENLRSGVPSLRADAVAELARARTLPSFFPGPAEVAPFAALLGRDSGLPGTTRVALVRLLDGAPGFEAGAALHAMTREPMAPEERLQLVRVLGAVDDPVLSDWIAAGLAGPDPALRREAAYALSHPWHARHAALLGAALRDADPNVARAAVRALGALGSPEAARMLEKEAARSESPLAPLARAELRRKAPAGQP